MTNRSDGLRQPVALFAGAHPDDVEIGAGGTVARLVRAGWAVWILVVTSERDGQMASIRGGEAIEAAGCLGVDESRVLFGGLPDAGLVCDGGSVGHIRTLLRDRGVYPDVVFTHTQADSHKDHREVNAIINAVFRRRPIAGFGVVNSLTHSRSAATAFEPRLYVGVTDTYEAKLSALDKHHSQQDRIYGDRIQAICGDFGRAIGEEYAEAFDLLIQDGASAESIAQLASLNDSPFHRFWSTILEGRHLVIVHAAPVWRSKLDGNWSSDKDREGISLIYRAFNQMWEGRVPVEDLSCRTAGIEEYASVYDLLLSGGAVSNSVTREYFNHFPGLRYVIDYSMPNYSDIRIFDRERDDSIRASYELDNRLAKRGLVRDTGILTLMPSPLKANRVILGCMGIHGHGTLACFRYLTEPLLVHELTTVVSLPLAGRGVQLLIDYDVRSEVASIRFDSLHVFETGE